MTTFHTPRRLGRPLVASVALVAASLALLPASSAQAAEPHQPVAGGTATWGTSDYLAASNLGRPNPDPEHYVAPATFNADTKLSTWGNATGSIKLDGSAELKFAGTSVNFAKTSGAWIKFADLEANLDAAGNGTVSAIVSYGMAPGSYPPAIPFDDTNVVRGPQRVVIANLAGNTAADRAVTATTATWTGLDATWAPELLSFVAGATPGEAFVYHLQFTNSGEFAPLPFTFSVNVSDLVKGDTELAAKWQKKPQVGKRGKLKITTVDGLVVPDGKVTVKMKRVGTKGKARTRNAQLVNGEVVVKLPKLAQGKWKITVKYAGNDYYGKDKVKKTVRVKPAKKK